MTPLSYLINKKAYSSEFFRNVPFTAPGIAVLTMAMLMCVNIACIAGPDFRNNLLAAALCISPVALLIFPAARIWQPRTDIPLLILGISVTLTPLIFFPETFRVQTILYTDAWCVWMMVFTRLLHISDITPRQFRIFLSCIIYAFMAMLVVQQFCVFFGFNVPNQGEIYHNPYKLNSLTSEPSHSSMVVCVMMLFLTLSQKTETPHSTLIDSMRRFPLQWLCSLWILFSTANVTAFILAPLPLLPFINRRNFLLATCIANVIGCSILIAAHFGERQCSRICDVASVITTLDEHKITDADISIADRIVPSIRGAKRIANIDIHTLTGHGTDADLTEIANRPFFRVDQFRGSAGIFKLWYNFGIIPAIALFYLIFITIVRKGNPVSFIVALLAIQLSADYNFQLLWMVMAVAMIYNYIFHARFSTPAH